MFGNRTATALSILQKTYDESYLTCSTAVYYESQVGSRPLLAVFQVAPLPEAAADVHRAEQRRRGDAMLETGARANLRPQRQPSPPQLPTTFRDRKGSDEQHPPTRAAV
jgi:hypothetical protein